MFNDIKTPIQSLLVENYPSFEPNLIERDENTYSRLQIRDTDLMMKMLSRMPGKFKKKFLTLLLLSDRNGLYDLVREMIAFHVSTDDSANGLGKSFFPHSQFNQRTGDVSSPTTNKTEANQVPDIQSAVILHRETISEPGRIIPVSGDEEVSQSSLLDPKVNLKDGIDVLLVQNANKATGNHNINEAMIPVNQDPSTILNQIQKNPSFDNMMKNLLNLMKTKQQVAQLMFVAKDNKFGNSANIQANENDNSNIAKQLDFNIAQANEFKQLQSDQNQQFINNPENFQVGDNSHPISIQLLSDDDIVSDTFSNQDHSIFLSGERRPQFQDTSEIDFDDEFIPSQVDDQLDGNLQLNGNAENLQLSQFNKLISGGQTIIPLSTDIEGQLFEETLINFNNQIGGSSTATSSLELDGDNELARFVPLSTDFEGQFTSVPLQNFRNPQTSSITSPGVGIPLQTNNFQQNIPNVLSTGSTGLGLAVTDFSQQSFGVPLPNPTVVNAGIVNSMNPPFEDATPTFNNQGLPIGVPLPSNINFRQNFPSQFESFLQSAQMFNNTNLMLQALANLNNGVPLPTNFPSIGVPLQNAPFSQITDGSIISDPLPTQTISNIRTQGNTFNFPSNFMGETLNSPGRPLVPIIRQPVGIPLPSIGFTQSSVQGGLFSNQRSPIQPGRFSNQNQAGVIGNGNISQKDLSENIDSTNNSPRFQSSKNSFESFEIGDTSFDADIRLSLGNHRQLQKNSKHQPVTFLTPGYMLPYGKADSGESYEKSLESKYGSNERNTPRRYPSKTYTGKLYYLLSY